MTTYLGIPENLDESVEENLSSRYESMYVQYVMEHEFATYRLIQPARPYYDTLLFLDINCYHAGFIYVFIGAVSFIVSGSFLMTL